MTDDLSTDRAASSESFWLHENRACNPTEYSPELDVCSLTSTQLLLNGYSSPTNTSNAIFLNVKLSHTRYRVLGPKLMPVYKQSAHRWLLKSLLSAEEHHHPLTSTKLCCLVTETHKCEQLAKVLLCSFVLMGIEPTTYWSQDKCSTAMPIHTIILTMQKYYVFITK